MNLIFFLFNLFLILTCLGGGTLCVSAQSMNTIGQSLILNDRDDIYRIIRNLSIERIGLFLQSKAVEAKLKYTVFKVIYSIFAYGD